MLREMGGMITDIAKFIHCRDFLFVVTASLGYTLLFILWIINYLIGLTSKKCR